MSSSALGREGEGAYAIRPYLAGRKRDQPFDFPVLGEEGEGAYAIRPYAFDRKKDHPLGFPVLGGED